MTSTARRFHRNHYANNLTAFDCFIGIWHLVAHVVVWKNVKVPIKVSDNDVDVHGDIKQK